MLNGEMSRDAVTITTVTMLAFGIGGMASDPTATRTLKDANQSINQTSLTIRTATLLLPEPRKPLINK